MTARLFTVTEFARELGVTPRALRFYEDKGLISPQRAGGTRVYSERDRARMMLILRGKRLGFSLAGIRDYLDLYDADLTQRTQLQVLLGGISSRRTQLIVQRETIDHLLTELDEIQAQAEAALNVPAARPRRVAGQR